MIHLPEAADVRLKGRVRSSVKTPVISIKNGMGIEIIENDPQYINFVRSVLPDACEGPVSESPIPDTSSQIHIQKQGPEGSIGETRQTEFSIIACTRCGARNNVNNAKLSLGPKCGKCGHPLTSRA